MLSANISEIKANFSYYIRLVVRKGEVVTICNHNVPVAEIRPISSETKEIIDSFYINDIVPKSTKKKKSLKKK